MLNNILINFLQGKGKDRHGRTHQDILNFSDEQLETVHNYIQWIFPIREMSENVMGSPYLDNDEEIQFLRNPSTRKFIKRTVKNARILSGQ